MQHPRDMMTVHAALRKFHNDETGQDLIEYALIAGCIGLGAVLSLKGLATSISNLFSAIGNTLTSNS